MFSKNPLIRTGCAVAFIVSCFYSAPSALSLQGAVSAKVSLSLYSFLSEHQLSTAKVRIAPFLVDPSEKWRSGVIGPLRPGFLIVSLRELNSPLVSSGIKLDIQTSRIQRVERCEAQKCTEVSVSPGRRLDVASEGARWQVQTHGFVCDGKLSCSLYYPSWALSQMINHRGQLRSFPESGLIVAHDRGLAIFDVVHRRLWEHYELPESMVGAKMLETRFISEGRMLVQFEAEALLFDWVNDLLYKFDQNGASVANSGIASLGSATSFNPVLSIRGEKEFGKFLGGHGDVLQWERIRATLGDSPSPFILSGDDSLNGQVISMSSVEGEYSILTKSAEGVYEVVSKDLNGKLQVDRVATPKGYEVLGVADQRVVLVGDGQIVTAGRGGARFPQIKGDRFVWNSRGALLLEEQQARDCRYSVYLYEIGNPKDFKLVPISDFCRARSNIYYSEAGLSIAIFDGAFVHINYLVPK